MSKVLVIATEVLKFSHYMEVHTYTQTHTRNVHTTLIAINRNNSSEIQFGYQAIKHTVILLPAATKHVTILLCPVLGALSKYDRRSHLFSQGECFNYRVASSLTTSAQMSVQSSPLFVEESSSKKNILCSLSGNGILVYRILAFEVTPPSFFPPIYDKSCVPSLLMLTITFL